MHALQTEALNLRCAVEIAQNRLSVAKERLDMLRQENLRSNILPSVLGLSLSWTQSSPSRGAVSNNGVSWRLY